MLLGLTMAHGRRTVRQGVEAGPAPAVAATDVVGSDAIAEPEDAIRRRVVAWRDGKVESRWRTWREGAGVPRRALGQTAGAPVGRWRARRQETLGSRSGRTLRARRSVSRSALEWAWHRLDHPIPGVPRARTFLLLAQRTALSQRIKRQ